MKRLGVETLVMIVLALGIVGVWWWKDQQWSSTLDGVQQQHEQDRIALQQDAEAWAEALALGEARAAFRSFAAGVAPAVLANRPDSVDQALVALLELPGVGFVHVLTPDGAVLASSDRKYTSSGTAGAEAAWALATSSLATRASDRTGLVELAAPIIGASGAAGYLWMGYDVERAREEARPAGLRPEVAPEPAPPTSHDVGD